MARGVDAVEVRLAFGLNNALAVLTDTARRTAHADARIVNAGVVLTSVVRRAIGITLTNLHAGTHDAPLTGRTIPIVEALLSHADPIDTVLIRWAVIISITSIAHAGTAFAMPSRLTDHALAGIVVNANTIFTLVIGPGAIGVNIAFGGINAATLFAAIQIRTIPVTPTFRAVDTKAILTGIARGTVTIVPAFPIGLAKPVVANIALWTVVRVQALHANMLVQIAKRQIPTILRPVTTRPACTAV